MTGWVLTTLRWSNANNIPIHKLQYIVITNRRIQDREQTSFVTVVYTKYTMSLRQIKFNKISYALLHPSVRVLP